MKIAVLGAGAMGSIYGGHLSAGSGIMCRMTAGGNF